ncbi:MAG TPA: hypothetical protein VM266_16330 [Solirubrobacteraceae bacterium]|nr:hypothetical protein [Solirubrobacteraceae bacterium]
MTAPRLLVILLVALAATPAAAAADPPPNDDRANARVLTDLPADVAGTTVDATSEPDDPGSRCLPSRNSVYYQFRAGADGRVVLRLQAEGDLDAVVDVFRRARSQLEGVVCAATDAEGAATTGFAVKAGETYLIRVAQLSNSVSGTFRLQLDRALPAARPPGTPLPAGGRRDSVDGVLNPSDAWSVNLRGGEEYRINLSSPVDPEGFRCVSLRVYGPDTKAFAGAKPVARRACGGYVLLTPRPEDAGRYTLRVVAVRGRGALPYSIEVAPAGDDDTAPGVFLPNLRGIAGELSGNRVDVVDLYRFTVRERSALRLRLQTTARLDLLLLGFRGKRLRCVCGDEGNQEIRLRVRAGRYFVAVRAQQYASGRYRLTRISRTITRTSIAINGEQRASAEPGTTLRLGVKVTPGVNGPVNVLVERFDPLAGWLFDARMHTRVRGGRQTLAFRPPTVGRWRARARFLGTRTAAGSRSGYAEVVVAEPITP